MQSIRGAVLVAAFAAVAATASSQVVRAGPEFRVNTSTVGDQGPAGAGMTASGDFVVVWESRPDPNTSHVYGQRYDARGSRLGGEFRLCPPTGAHFFPHMDMDARGNFVVVWAGTYPPPTAVFGQRFDPTGAPIGAEFRVGAVPLNPSDVAMHPDGRFVVTGIGYNYLGDDETGGWARRYAADGTPLGPTFLVNTYTTGWQQLPSVAFDAAGRFVIAWYGSEDQDGSQYGAFAQRFDADGSRIGGEFQVNTYTTNSQMFTDIAVAPAGDFIVTWSSFTQDGSDDGVYAQRFAASGGRRGGEFRVNTQTLFRQTSSRVAVAEAGRFVIGWTSFGQDGSGYGAFAQRFDADGAPMGGEFQVNSYTIGTQALGSVTMDPAGNLLALLASDAQDGSGYGAYGQRHGGLVPAAMVVDTGGNGVLEPAEATDVRPSWRNVNGAAQAFSGTLLAAAGAPGTITDGSAGYGTVADGAIGACTDCYAVAVGALTPRPALHVDVFALESITPVEQGQEKWWRLHVGRSFDDVAVASPFYRFVEALLHHSVTGGCAASAYCPVSSTTREQMAVFVLAAKDGSGHVPPACGTPVFADVPASSPFCRWVEELARRGVVAGCGGGNYCPAQHVTRDQMSVFVLRTLEPGLVPPACVAGSERFADVPAASPFCPWVEELARRGIVAGCGGGDYCPGAPVSREQMGVFIGETFGLALYGP